MHTECGNAHHHFVENSRFQPPYSGPLLLCWRILAGALITDTHCDSKAQSVKPEKTLQSRIKYTFELNALAFMSERLFESPFWWRVIFECIQPYKFMNPNQCLRIPHFQHQNQLYQLKTAFVSTLNCLVSSQKWWNLNLLTTMANILFGRIRFSSKLITRPSSEVTRDTKLTVSGENVHNKNQFNMFLSGIQWMFGPHRKREKTLQRLNLMQPFF